MRGEIAWFHDRLLDQRAWSSILDGLASVTMTPYRAGSGRLLMLSSAAGAEGERYEAALTDIHVELTRVGQATFLYWLRDSVDTNVAISFANMQSRSVIMVSLDGLDRAEATKISRDMVKLSLQSDLELTSRGLVIDQALPDDGFDDWQRFFLEDGRMPPYIPLLLWHKRDVSSPLVIQAREADWLFPPM